MQILLANAKIMFNQTDMTPTTTPLFQSVAELLAMEMASMDIDELGRQLDCSRKLAAENKQRYHNFFTARKMPAILAYNGQAYKHLKASTLSPETLQFGNSTYGSHASSTACYALWMALSPIVWNIA